MITQLDQNNSWSKELVTGNAQFLEISGTIYIVSQVRADNTFAVFKSEPVPPQPGPGYAFDAPVVVYTFPNPNTSFDPVIAYDGARYIYIVGTQDGLDGTDVLLFVYDIEAESASPPNPLGSPVKLVTASYIRDSYDICTLEDNQFIAVAVTNPTTIWQTPTVSQVTAISITGGVATVTANNSFLTGQNITFSGLQLADLNNVSATVLSEGSGSFTADNFVATEVWTVPLSGAYTITVNNSEGFLLNSKVVYTASSNPLTNVTGIRLPNRGEYTVLGGVYTFNALDAAVKISISYLFTPLDYSQLTGEYESGFATWLPGHSLLGFEMDMGTLNLSPATTPFVSVVVLDSSPFSSGNTFGSVSAYSPDGVSIEVYYESHPKQVTFADQFFNLNLATFTISPPMWNLPATVLTTFSGRYADCRLTVIPNGTTRTLLQQYYSQRVHQNALVGNLLLGYYDSAGSPPTWNFHVQPGSADTSYIQGTLSVSTQTSPPVPQAFVSYIAEPIYDIRGVWSPMVKFYGTDDRFSYNTTPPLDSGWADYYPLVDVSYAYQGAWAVNTLYAVGDVVKWGNTFYTAIVAIASKSSTPPDLDVAHWEKTLTPDVDSRFALVPTAWPIHANSLDVSTFNMVDIPGFYNNYNFTWLRGTKTVLDDKTMWGAVGERRQGSSPEAVFYVSDFDVPPVVSLVPDGFTTIVERGTPFFLDARGTNDGSLDPITFTWTMNSNNPDIQLVPDGSTATVLVDKTIGGLPFVNPLLVGVVATTPLHQSMTITNITVASGVATITTDAPVELAATEKVFLYNIGTATFLSDRVGFVVASAFGDGFSVTFTDGLPTPDYTSAPDTGSAVANQQFDFVAINISFNPVPTVDFPINPIQAERNSRVTITPTYTGVNDPDDATTYSWVQVSGTTIPAAQILSGTTLPFLEFETDGVLIQGETIVWNVIVNDGVNAPVVGEVTVDVAAYPFDYPDNHVLSRANWSGNISQRNTVQTWSTLDVSAFYTNLKSIRRTSVLDGTDRYLLISSGSVSVYGGINPDVYLLRKLFPPVNNALIPPASQPVMDAVHSEDDWTLVLDGAGNLYQFSIAPLINTDNPIRTINLSAITTMSFNKVFLTSSFGNVRVVILTGSNGCLLLQLRNTDLTIEGFLELSTESQMLYGVDNVQFVRTSNVESLNTGKILLGTIASVVANIVSIGVFDNTVTVEADNTFAAGDVVTFVNLTQAGFLNGVTASVASASFNQFVVSFGYVNYPVTLEGASAQAIAGGKTYETLIDLSHGQIIGTWDASKLHNQFVTTGEILFETNNTYAGTPVAPVLNPITSGAPTAGYVNLGISWTADRPDLIQSYELDVSFDPLFGTFTANSINSGYIQTVTLPEPVNQVFYFRVRANSVDGVSPYSNIQTITTGVVETSPPLGFAISFGAGFGSS